MAVTVPSTYPRSSDASDTVRRHAAVQSDHVEAITEAEAFARARLRSFVSFGAESRSTTSTTYVDVIEERPVTASDHHSDSVSVLVRGDNMDCKVTISDGSGSVNGTVSVGAGPANASGTINVSTLTGTDWRVTVEMKVPSSGTASIYGLNIRETRHTAGTIA